MHSPVSLLLIDDHFMIAESLANTLAGFDDLEVKGALSDPLEAPAFLENNPVQVVIMEVQTLSQDSLTAYADIQKKLPGVKILFLSFLEDAANVRSALAAGCSGYITKHSGITELHDAILTVAAGQKYFSERIVKSLADTVVAGDHRNNSLRIDGLSARELEVAGLIAQGHTTEEIADKICLSVNTVESYRSKLIKKIGVKNSAELAAWAAKNGVV